MEFGCGSSEDPRRPLGIVHQSERGRLAHRVGLGLGQEVRGDKYDS